MIRQQTALRDLALSPAARPDNHGMSHGGRFVMKEIWKPIAGYEGHYDISSFGRVRYYKKTGLSKYTKILKLGFNVYGYRVASLYKNSRKHFYTIHRLVTTTFIGKRPDHFDVSHLDGNKLNNKLSNLVYESRKDNENRKAIHGTKLFGDNHPSSKLSLKQVIEIHKLSKDGVKTCDLARRFSVSSGCISSILLGENWVLAIQKYYELRKGKP